MSCIDRPPFSACQTAYTATEKLNYDYDAKTNGAVFMQTIRFSNTYGESTAYNWIIYVKIMDAPIFTHAHIIKVKFIRARLGGFLWKINYDLYFYD